MEIILNCDLVIASDDAVFALPEVKRGVVAAQGGEWHTEELIQATSRSMYVLAGIPRIKAAVGHQVGLSSTSL